MIKKIIGATLVAAIATLLIVLPVLAIATPDTTATIDAVSVYRSCLETNDQLYIIEYNIPYATPPSELVSEAYFFRLMNGTTELKSNTAYAYNDSGYNEGIAAIYFTATEVSDNGMTWQGSYTVVIAGNPTLTWTGGNTPYEISTPTVWNDPMGDTLADDIRTLAQSLSSDWGLAAATDLFTTDAGTVFLSSQGADYFGTSIPNLMNMQPDIFSASAVGVDFYERDNPLTYATSINYTYWAGTWVGNALDPTATALGISGAFVYALFWGVVTIALLMLIAIAGIRDYEILLLLGGVMTVFGALLHFIPMLIPVLIGAVLVIMFVYKSFLRPSGA